MSKDPYQDIINSLLAMTDDDLDSIIQKVKTSKQELRIAEEQANWEREQQTLESCLDEEQLKRLLKKYAKLMSQPKQLVKEFALQVKLTVSFELDPYIREVVGELQDVIVTYPDDIIEEAYREKISDALWNGVDESVREMLDDENTKLNKQLHKAQKEAGKFFEEIAQLADEGGVDDQDLWNYILEKAEEQSEE